MYKNNFKLYDLARKNWLWKFAIYIVTDYIYLKCNLNTKNKD